MNDQQMTRQQFACFYPVTTRWHDNDVYGHVNNVTYYSFFDSAVNRYLIEEGGLDIHTAPVVAFVVESQCRYFQPIAYPQDIHIGVSVSKLGARSVTYQLGVFVGDETMPRAQGSFVHVFVDRTTQRAVAIPDNQRRALQLLLQDPSQ
ncbi:acyl-CoA thioesterase [Aestuariibacter halophilus]|uniref:Acyl-CoA thioesterase n=1 Tax=Fluctibacter halophilus TaxID=226011 RepID=A0ABS8GA72_9ALTE|nr:thioesterase family protein [Aestuariibacter halophilus]MCC2617492.1 acyl-CoA thioesterase [Aestuariibacter halophilus]